MVIEAPPQEVAGAGISASLYRDLRLEIECERTPFSRAENICFPALK